MRFSPGDARYLVCERGQHPSDGPRRLEVRDLTTGAVTTFAAGYNPRWLTASEIVAESPTGLSFQDARPDWLVRYIPANRGQLDANGHGVWAVSDLVWAVVHEDGTEDFFGNAREPRLSASARLAARNADGALFIDRRPIATGCEDARWSSETLVWWLGGRVWGRSTADAPTVELTIPGRACSHPAPLWTGSQLFVAMVLDEGELVIAEWGSLVRRESRGWRVAVSDGSGFDHALCVAGETT